MKLIVAARITRGLDHPGSISVAASVEALLPTCRAPGLAHRSSQWERPSPLVRSASLLVLVCSIDARFAPPLAS